ncbi:hypothetical protein Acy02nite_68780 [Actinoplanes cyaneus]|uniref:Uncharacterized protein n=1 Tax=Actinoplanes cyaneus TaxID=52696 RepID=A0A919IPI8_9ACTN|nr:hypothetical protein Acy02nite_68780 [Actinoplanes cyaneus]
MKLPSRPARGRGAAYVGTMLGAVVSIAANIAHTFIPPEGAPADWTPKVGAVLISIFWPVALAVVVEVFARVPWPRTWWAWLVRVVGLAPVAAVAAVVSYRHLSGLLSYYGEDPIAVRFGPIAVDGLMLISTVAIIVTGHATTITEHAIATVLSPPAVPTWRPPLVPPGARLLPLVSASPVPSTADDVLLTDPDGDTREDGELLILPSTNRRRPAAETRRQFELLKKAEPRISQEAAAKRLGMSRWALRDALAATAKKTA